MKDIYFAGGCFWGIEKLFASLPGVIATECGYANGLSDIVPTYEKVCYGGTGFRETVKVVYDENQTSTEALLFAYYSVIDPTIPNRQGPDKGSQYQVGIYFTDDETEKTVRRISEIEKASYDQFVVEIKPLKNYYTAEDYHQKYLDKNPRGYCHINPVRISEIAKFHIRPEEYNKPAREILKIEI